MCHRPTNTWSSPAMVRALPLPHALHGHVYTNVQINGLAAFQFRPVTTTEPLSGALPMTTPRLVVRTVVLGLFEFDQYTIERSTRKLSQKKKHWKASAWLAVGVDPNNEEKGAA